MRLVWKGPVADACLPPIPRRMRRDTNQCAAWPEARDLAFRGMRDDFRDQWEGGPLVGPVRVRVTAYWPGRHMTGSAAGLPQQRPSGVMQCVIEALQKAGIIGHVDQVGPRTEDPQPVGILGQRVVVELDQDDEGPTERPPDPHGGMAQAGL